MAALTWRWPRKLSVLKGRSRCDRCSNPISWYDNLPVISYLLLRGRCRGCGQPISFRYPFIEVVSAVGLVLLAKQIYFWPLFLILLAVFVIDWEHRIIPDELLLVGFLISLPYFSFANLLAGFSAASFILFLHLITRGKGMGFGDVKLALLLGFVLGLSLTPVWLWLAFIFGAIIGLVLMAFKKAKLGQPIPFGPYLIVAFWVTMFWGEKLLNLIHAFL